MVESGNQAIALLQDYPIDGSWITTSCFVWVGNLTCFAGFASFMRASTLLDRWADILTFWAANVRSNLGWTGLQPNHFVCKPILQVAREQIHRQMIIASTVWQFSRILWWLEIMTTQWNLFGWGWCVTLRQSALAAASLLFGCERSRLIYQPGYAQLS